MTLEEKLEEAIVKDIPYEVPENWVWSNIGSISTEIKNGTTIKQNKDQDGIKVTRIESLQNNSIDLNRLGTIVEVEKLKEKDYYKNGDIALSHINSLEHVGKTALIDKSLLPLVHGMNLLRVRVNKDLINPKFFQFYTRGYDYKDEVIARVNRAVNQVSLNQKNLSDISFPIPPLKEQQRIVDRIESLFEKLDKAKELIEEAREGFDKRKAAILEKAFRGELTEKWREENNKNFNFDKVKFQELIAVGPQNGLYKPRSAYGEGNLIVRIDNFYDGEINPWHTLKRLVLSDDEKDLYSLDDNDIIINRVNSIDYVGKSALVKNIIEPCVFESNVMRLKLVPTVNVKYIIKYLNSISGLQELRKNAKHAVNQASINQQDVKNTLIPIPSIEEQNQIIQILEKLVEKESKIEELTQLEDQIELIKKSILAKAFRGELGTNCEDDESALELLKGILSKS